MMENCKEQVSGQKVWILTNADQGSSIIKTEFHPRIPVTNFEDEYYKKEWLNEEAYLHTIKYGYAEAEKDLSKHKIDEIVKSASSGQKIIAADRFKRNSQPVSSSTNGASKPNGFGRNGKLSDSINFGFTISDHYTGSSCFEENMCKKSDAMKNLTEKVQQKCKDEQITVKEILLKREFEKLKTIFDEICVKVDLKNASMARKLSNNSKNIDELEIDWINQSYIVEKLFQQDQSPSTVSLDISNYSKPIDKQDQQEQKELLSNAINNNKHHNDVVVEMRSPKAKSFYGEFSRKSENCKLNETDTSLQISQYRNLIYPSKANTIEKDFKLTWQKPENFQENGNYCKESCSKRIFDRNVKSEKKWCKNESLTHSCNVVQYRNASSMYRSSIYEKLNRELELENAMARPKSSFSPGAISKCAETYISSLTIEQPAFRTAADCSRDALKNVSDAASVPDHAAVKETASKFIFDSPRSSATVRRDLLRDIRSAGGAGSGSLKRGFGEQ